MDTTLSVAAASGRILTWACSIVGSNVDSSNRANFLASFTRDAKRGDHRIQVGGPCNKTWDAKQPAGVSTNALSGQPCRPAAAVTCWRSMQAWHESADDKEVDTKHDSTPAADS
jgi:hypothetical protein